MRLFIAEKPSLGAAIAEILPGKPEKVRGKSSITHIKVGDDVVSWCFGHIYELFEPEDYSQEWKAWSLASLPLMPKAWKKKAKTSAKEQISVIKGLLQQCKEVVHAGDPDREGQLLVDEVLEELGNKKPVKRLLLSAIDEGSIKRALADLRDNKDFAPLRDSAEARSFGDWLVGMNATRKMTLIGQQRGFDGVFSVGRVQTPTLALVVERDLAIKAFKAKDFFTISATLEKDGQAITCRYVAPDDCPHLDESGRLIDSKAAQAIQAKLQGATAEVSRFDSQEKSEAQPLCFSLDSLQIEAHKLFNLSAQETLDIAQELYEGKLISYPRSDCGHLPESQHGDAGRILAALAQDSWFTPWATKADANIKSGVWNDKKVSAHHGIIPTGHPAFEKLTGVQASLYKLVALRYILQFYPKHRYQEHSLAALCAGEQLQASGKSSLDLGWKEPAAALIFHLKANTKDQSPDDEGESASKGGGLLPVCQVGDKLLCLSAKADKKKTTPPARFNEASLLQAMLNVHLFEKDPEVKKRLKDSLGIGTPATRAKILETLKGRGFLTVSKKSLIATEKGEQLISVLPESLKSPGLTALFEEMLEQVAQGKLAKGEFLRQQQQFVEVFVKTDINPEWRAEGIACPSCKLGILRQRASRQASRAAKSASVFWGCSRYPECKSSFADQDGKPNLEPRAFAVLSSHHCKLCQKPLILRKGPRGNFWGCSGFPNCRTTYQDQEGQPLYPSPAAQEKSAAQASGGQSWSVF
jgi:DNA topoisomerase-3